MYFISVGINFIASTVNSITRVHRRGGLVLLLRQEIKLSSKLKCLCNRTTLGKESWFFYFAGINFLDKPEDFVIGARHTWKVRFFIFII